MPKTKQIRTSRMTYYLLLPVSLIILIFGSAAGNAVRESLNICARVLIPSLFPYMVISSILVRAASAELYGKRFDGIMRKLFDLPGCALSSILLGALCGFPIGAKSACELHSRGLLNSRETERLIAVANNAGPAFVIEVVGVCFWNSRGMGVVLYAAQIFTAALIGIMSAHLPCRKKYEPHQKLNPSSQNEPYSFLLSLSDAVKSSAQSMLSICGFVVFFSAVSALLEQILGMWNLQKVLPFFTVLLEFSGGSAQAASVGGVFGAFLAGMAVGWSGLSVFAQCCIFTAEAGLRLRTAFLYKFTQGILCGVITMLWYKTSCISASAVPAAQMSEFPAYALAIEIVLMILFCLFPIPRRYADLGRTRREIRKND